MAFLNLPVVLKNTETEGSAFQLAAGIYDISVGVTGSNTLPTTVNLQRRFKDESGTWTTWQTDFSITTANDKNDTFYASSQIEFRVTASAAGASVSISPVVGF